MWRAICNDRGVRWVSVGWTAFVTENLVLSEFRQEIIERIGDDKYHLMYNGLSTAACASVVYGFAKYRHQTRIWAGARPPRPVVLLGLVCNTAGLVMLSQCLPKVQLPVTLVREQRDQSDQSTSTSTSTARTPSNLQLKSQCPFDFGASSNHSDKSQVSGIVRVTRHASLWGLALVAAGTALSTVWASTVALAMGPMFMAVVGSYHTDMRYARGSGGLLTAEVAQVTSNVPFGAVLAGHQSMEDIWRELKLSNASIAVATAVLLALTRLR
jgi:uncharacterized membrane protein